jgi:hypothetical protein
MTVEGGTTSAAAPASANAAPWPTTNPALARPNACARRSFGSLSTNAVFAAIWYITNPPETAKIAIDTARPGRKMVATSVPQAHTAIGPIQRSRVRGPIRLVKIGVITAAPI